MLLDLHFEVHQISNISFCGGCRPQISHMVILLMMDIDSMVRCYYVSFYVLSPDFWILSIVLGYQHVILNGFTLMRLIFIHTFSGTVLHDYLWILARYI